MAGMAQRQAMALAEGGHGEAGVIEWLEYIKKRAIHTPAEEPP